MITLPARVTNVIGKSDSSVGVDGGRSSRDQATANAATKELLKVTKESKRTIITEFTRTELTAARHELPQHPLFEQGYSTVGDWHSSAPDDGLGRASRFGGRHQECGLHLPEPLVEGAGI